MGALRAIVGDCMPFVAAMFSLGVIWRNCSKHRIHLRFGWSERRDLNSGPPVPQTGALTGLRYAPNGADYSGWG